MRALLDRISAGARSCGRASWVAGELLTATVRAGFFPPADAAGGAGRVAPAPSGGRPGARWLHQTCRRLLRVFSPRLRVHGAVPTRGLLVANHLGYFDVIVLAALTPCVFVSKSEVKSWPVFGWFARRAGTIFITRTSRRDAVRATEEIRAALGSGALVVLFPEGTSSDGSAVQPFKSSLLEAVTGPGPDGGFSVFIAALHYELEDGNAAEEVCYWGEHTLAPHLWRLLSKRRVRVAAAFVEIPDAARERKSLARQLHGAVSHLHSGLRAPGGPARHPARLPEAD